MALFDYIERPSVKDQCLGMTLEEIEDKYLANYDSLTKQIWVEGVYYQLFCDEDTLGNRIVVDVVALFHE